MCGACGDRRDRDEWTVDLDSTRARWEAASLLNRVLGRTRAGTTVVPTPRAWLVRSATGRGVMADTATALWRALEPMPPLDTVRAVLSPRGIGVGDRSLVARTLLAAYQHVCDEDPLTNRGIG